MNISRGDIVHQITVFSKFLFYFDIFVFVLLLRAPCFWEMLHAANSNTPDDES